MPTAVVCWILVGVSWLVVVSDSMLAAFYPQYFAEVFGIDSSLHAGAYVGATCLTVIVGYPFWAQLSRGRSTLRVLVATQAGAALFALGSACAPTVALFWACSLAMIFFKGSYLLVYPYLMSLASSSERGHWIGVLTVVVHFGAIGGALVGGFVLDRFDPRIAYVLMAGADLLQMGVCLALLGWNAPGAETAPLSEAASIRARTDRAVYSLAGIMFIFCFSAFLTRPFFAQYWAQISRFSSELAAGAVFSIPGWVALVVLLWNRRFRKDGPAVSALTSLLLWGAVGLALQASSAPAGLLLGRLLYGVALFQVTVGLERRLFDASTPDRYASDFAKLHVAQNAGAMLAAVAAGYVVGYGLALPLALGAFGFVCTAMVHRGSLSGHPPIAEIHGDAYAQPALDPSTFIGEERGT